MSFKILLISPPIFDFYFTPARGEALGLQYIKNSLSPIEDIEVDIYDSRASRKIKKRAFPPHFEYLKKYYIKDSSYFSLFSSYYRFGDSFNKVVNKIKEKDYDLVAISSLFSGYHNNVEKLIKRIKDEIDIPIVLGGWAIEAEKEKLFKESLADYFIFGDAENNFNILIKILKLEKSIEPVGVDLVPTLNKDFDTEASPSLLLKEGANNSNLIKKPSLGSSNSEAERSRSLNKTLFEASNSKKQNISGILSKKEFNVSQKYLNKIIKESFSENSSFEKIPIRTEKYFFKGKRIAKVTLSRGCKFNCSFCAIPKYQKFKIRTFESIIKELNYLLSIGIEVIDFEDDNLFFRKDWSNKFLDILIEFHKKGLTYSAMNGITAINLLPFTQKALDAGFIEFNLSLVSSNELTSNNIKRANFKSPIEVISNITSGKIDIVVFLIAGLPENTPDMLLKDILYLAKLPVRIGISPLYLVPGIDMFEDMGLPKNRDYLRGSALHKFGDNFSKEDVVSIWKYVRMINALKYITDKKDLEENLLYFKKSINEKIWYYKDKTKWKKSFSFSLDLPQNIKINRNNKIVSFF